MRNLTITQRLYYGFGISMAILMVLTLFLPALAPDTPVQQDIPPTEPPPVPTFPPPLTNFDGIAFEEDALENNGLFAVGVPTGWEVNTAAAPPGQQSQISLNNPDQLSVIQVQVEQSPAIQTVEELRDNYFTSARLSGSWSSYRNPQELARTIEDDRLLLEFALENAQRQEFFARHVSWTDGTWIYTARVVVPRDATDLLDYLLEPVIASIKPQTQFKGTPVNWTAYYDERSDAIIRYPSSWTITDGGSAGVPTSFSVPGGVALRVETQESEVTDEDAARAWVEGILAGITAESVEPIERNGGTGFNVAYTYTTPDGEAQSGFAVLLNGENGLLHTANALLPSAGVDLTAETIEPIYNDLVTALGSFSLITGLNLPEPEVEPEATPEPEVEATEEATEEATDDASDMDEAEATEEAAEDES